MIQRIMDCPDHGHCLNEDLIDDLTARAAELEAENKRLREALDAANEDAERLCKLVTGAVFSSRLGYVDTAEGATAYRLHRARVGAKGGDK